MTKEINNNKTNNTLRDFAQYLLTKTNTKIILLLLQCNYEVKWIIIIDNK